MLRTIAIGIARRSSAAEALFPGLRAPAACAVNQEIGFSRLFSAQVRGVAGNLGAP